MTDISLEPGEEMVWQGVISRGMLLVSLIGFLIPTLVMGIFAFTQNLVGFSSCGGRYQIDVAGCLARNPNTYVNGALLGSIIIGVGLILLLVGYFWKLVQQYTVTTKRVMIKSGLIRTNYKSIYFNQIKSVLKKSGWMDRMFGLGTIKIDTGRVNFFHSFWSTRETSIQWDYLTHVDNPEKVYQYIHTAIVNNTQDSGAVVNSSPAPYST